MKKLMKMIPLFALLLMLGCGAAALPVNAQEAEVTTQAQETNPLAAKAFAAAICVGLAAAVGAGAMGLATSKAEESIARQPEAEGSIRTTFMLGLVFIETAIIYALIVAILIIFVL